MKKSFLLLFFIFNVSIVSAQTKTEIDSLLTKISEAANSKEITKTKEAEYIISSGKKTLLILSEFFTDQTKTNVNSECHNRTLTKGEVAIILADKIEEMPFAKLTGVQNCILEFCDNNPNLIEYYFHWIKEDNAKSFTEKYISWLNSKERKKMSK